MKIVIASTNEGKLREIKQITNGMDLDIVSRDDAGVPSEFEIAETGDTFEENSRIKAYEIMQICECAAIADDSGLEVDVLGGEPGVHSARYAGEHADDVANRKKLIEKVKSADTDVRSARFVCVITMVMPDGTEAVCRGSVEGQIITKERGDNGFGYDSIFVPDGYDKTFAQMPVEEKNKISHRARALEQLKKVLAESLEKQ